MTLAHFIQKRRYLVWYVRDPAKLSKEAVVEAVLNYGDWDDVQKLVKILGRKQMARIFRQQINRKRVNYHPKTAHFFRLYFGPYA